MTARLAGTVRDNATLPGATPAERRAVRDHAFDVAARKRRLWCDECCHVLYYPNGTAECANGAPVRFVVPGSQGDVHEHNWGWTPVAAECTSFVEDVDSGPPDGLGVDRWLR